MTDKNDKILQMFFDINRWTEAIEKGVTKDIALDARLCRHRAVVLRHQRPHRHQQRQCLAEHPAQMPVDAPHPQDHPCGKLSHPVQSEQGEDSLGGRLAHHQRQARHCRRHPERRQCPRAYENRQRCPCHHRHSRRSYR